MGSRGPLRGFTFFWKCEIAGSRRFPPVSGSSWVRRLNPCKKPTGKKSVPPWPFQVGG
jgi:hypothetical protein